MDGRKRKRDPWIVSSLKRRNMRLYRCELIHSHTGEKQTVMIPSVSPEDVDKKLVVRLARLNKRQYDGSFWFANKTVVI